VAVSLATAASCEWVLGDLPPVDQGPDGGTGASGTASSTAASSTHAASGTAASSTAASTGGTGGSCCDCDGDSYHSKALCGADDCDDHDPLVHPGQTTYFATPSQNPNVGWDYDCDGKLDQEFPNPINCALLAGNCDAGVGFFGSVPPCGQTGAWGNCVNSSAVTCKQNVIDSARVCKCR
jgi:hypothetical protein